MRNNLNSAPVSLAFLVLIPSIPLSFHTLSINRSDGSCTPHYHGQTNFSQLLQTQQHHGQPEINRNVDVATPLIAELPLVSSSTAGVPINEQMSRSMHEARNHIFEDQHMEVAQPTSLTASPRLQRRIRPRPEAAAAAAAGACPAAASPTEQQTLPTQLSFAMDPSYNVLWVFDGVGRKLRCHNVVASEISESDVVGVMA